MTVPRTRSNRNPLPRRYVYAALTSGSVVPVLMMAAAVMVLSVPLAIALGCLGELGVVLVLLRARRFRAHVDAQWERSEAAALRAGLLEQMSAPHRSELAQLDRLEVAIRRHCGRDGKGSDAAADSAVVHWLELERLLALYIQIAIAHRDATTSFPPEDDAALAAATEQMRAASLERGGSTDACLQRRGAILQRRRETWTQAIAERDRLAQELSTIVDLVHWMHETCALARGGSVRVEMERVLASWELSGDALREVSALCRSDGDLLDPATLALGRDELAKRAEDARRPDAWASSSAGGAPSAPIAQRVDLSAEPPAAATLEDRSVVSNKADVVTLRARPLIRAASATASAHVVK